MNDVTRAQILAKNERLIAMVIERAKRDFPEDIALIGLTGSFATGDYHEKSDLDLIIVNDTPRGWEIAVAFILDDVGYDIYCTPWAPRIEDQAALVSPMVGCLVDLQVLYCAKPEHLARLESYQQRALAELKKPIGADCLSRAKKWIGEAKMALADAQLSEEIGAVRNAAGTVLYNAVNALVSMNNSYIRRGVKRYLEEIGEYAHVPEGFTAQYMALVEANSEAALREAARALLGGVIALHEQMWEQFVGKIVPTRENLRGTYEEFWCNCRNKVLRSTQDGDAVRAFLAALGAQQYLDEMTQHVAGTPRFDLMRHFDAADLGVLRREFLAAMERYLDEYRKAGLSVERFDSFEQLYARFMGGA